jgi:Spy/CpxP family protein refolding chaperone
MKFGPLAVALCVTALPVLAQTQTQDAGLATDEQILLKQVMTDRKSVYANNLKLTEDESKQFWPIYDAYEAKVKKVNDRFLANLNRFVENYDTLSENDAAEVLKEKMAIEKEREALKQEYTRKVAKVLPPKKALRYAQIETRVDNMLRRDVYSLIPLAN